MPFKTAARPTLKTYLKSYKCDPVDDIVEEAKLIKHIVNLNGEITVTVKRNKGIYFPEEYFFTSIPNDVRTLDDAITIGALVLFPKLFKGSEYFGKNIHNICEFFWKNGDWTISISIPNDGYPVSTTVFFHAIGDPFLIEDNPKYATAFSLLKEEFERFARKNGIPCFEDENHSERSQIESKAELSELNSKTFSKTGPTAWGNSGRNNPCPCGSGLKFKHCHGQFS